MLIPLFFCSFLVFVEECERRKKKKKAPVLTIHQSLFVQTCTNNPRMVTKVVIVVRPTVDARRMAKATYLAGLTYSLRPGAPYKAVSWPCLDFTVIKPTPSASGPVHEPLASGSYLFIMRRDQPLLATTAWFGNSFGVASKGNESGTLGSDCHQTSIFRECPVRPVSVVPFDQGPRPWLLVHPGRSNLMIFSCRPYCIVLELYSTLWESALMMAKCWLGYGWVNTRTRVLVCKDCGMWKLKLQGGQEENHAWIYRFLTTSQTTVQRHTFGQDEELSKVTSGGWCA